MKKIVSLSIMLLLFCSINAQESIKKVLLKEGVPSTIHYNDLKLNTLLQIRNEGNISLKIDANDESIANFYINKGNKEKKQHTIAYKNYVLTFLIQNNTKYLLIEQSKFGKAFTLSNDGIVIINDNEDEITIEITDVVHEWGYDGPPEDPNRNYFSDVLYTIEVKVGNDVKNLWVSSTKLESQGHLSIDVARYTIVFLSDTYGHQSSSMEMRIDRKK